MLYENRKDKRDVTTKTGGTKKEEKKKVRFRRRTERKKKKKTWLRFCYKRKKNTVCVHKKSRRKENKTNLETPVHDEPTTMMVDKGNDAKNEDSHTSIISRKQRLLENSAEDKSVSAYMQEMRGIADDLALVNCPVGEGDLDLHILHHLGNDFKEICAAVQARDTPISFDELH
ncbi:LTR copia-type gag-polypeptide [Tanacetum coccineum]